MNFEEISGQRKRFWRKITSRVAGMKNKIGMGICSLVALLGSGCEYGFEHKDFPPPIDYYCESTLGCEENDFSKLSIEELIDALKCPNDVVFYKRDYLDYDSRAYEEAREVGALVGTASVGDLVGGNIEEVHQSGKATCYDFSVLAMHSLHDNGFPPLIMFLKSQAYPFSEKEPFSHNVYVFNYLSDEGEESYGILGIHDFEEYYGFHSLKDIAAFYTLLYGLNSINLSVFEMEAGKDNKLYWKYIVGELQYNDTFWNKTEEFDQKRLDAFFERLIPYDTCPLESE